MALTNVEELKPGINDKVIEVKVYRSWTARDPPNTMEKGYRAILLDRQGDAIQANMEATDIEYFKTILIPGTAYGISDFQCIKTENWQQTLENQTSLSFTRFTKFDNIPAENFPHHYFNFLSYNQLPTKIVDPQNKGKKTYPVLTDYIGCYIQSGEAEKIGNPNRNQSIIRRVGIENLNRNYIELTLWDELAQSFKKEAIDALEKPIIIAVSSCRVSKYRNRDFQLSSTPATYYYINPNIPQLEHYQSQYRQLYNQQPPLNVIRYRFENKEQEKYRNRVPLNVLISQDPGPYQGIRFTCEGTIVSINKTRDWYYISCTMCNAKPRDNDGVYHCKQHGVLSETTYRYNFKATVTDTTQTAQFTFFTPTADAIVGIDCPTLVKSLENPDPRIFPEKIDTIIGAQHIFQFYFSSTCREGAVEFILSDILDDPQSDPQIEITTSDISTHVEPTAAIECISTPQAPQITETPEKGIQTMEHSSETSTPAPTYTGMQTRSRTEIPTDVADTPYIGMQTRSKTDMGTEQSRKSAKRPLFQDEQTDIKKKERLMAKATQVPNTIHAFHQIHLRKVLIFWQSGSNNQIAANVTQL